MDTRHEILRVALESFAEHGYERTTIAALRDRSGVSNGALFHHFPTKEAIAAALYVEAMEDVQDGYRRLLDLPVADLAGAVAGIITHQLTWVSEHCDQARLLYSLDHLDPSSAAAGELGALNRDLAAAWRRWLQPLIARGDLRDLPFELMIAIVNGPAHAICRRWLAGHLPGTPLEYAPELIAAAVAGLTGTPTSSPPPRRVAPVLEVRLLDADDNVVAHGRAELRDGTR
jgi:AcrR family transcriptional regulator